jgi:hypothetical protein
MSILHVSGESLQRVKIRFANAALEAVDVSILKMLIEIDLPTCLERTR